MFSKASREMTGMVISCMGSAAVLSMFSPALLIGPIGVTLLGFALLGALLTVVTDVRHGRNVIVSLFSVLLLGAATFALVWAPLLYFQWLVPPGEPLFRFGR